MHWRGVTAAPRFRFKEVRVDVIDSTLRVIAPAKVNLYLEIGGRRADGFHDVTTVLTAVDLADEIMMRHADCLTSTCEPDLGIPAEENLAYRAARDLAGVLGRNPDVDISVRKRIPHGAGLGGGSSDAAGVLAGLAQVWGLAPDNETVLGVARSLGADVAFFLYGGTALFDERGDRFVRSLPFVPLDLVLVRPDEPVPTGAAYAAFDRQLHASPPGVDPLEGALEARDVSGIATALFNNMTEASVGLVEAVGEALAWTRSREGVMGAAMAGSGSAVYGICRDATVARSIAEDARSAGWWSQATRTLPHGVRVELEGGVA